MKNLTLEEANARIDSSPRMTRGKIEEICSRDKLDYGATSVEFQSTGNNAKVIVKIRDHRLYATGWTETREYITKSNEDFLGAVERHCIENGFYLEDTKYTPEQEVKGKSFLGFSSSTIYYPKITANLYRLR